MAPSLAQELVSTIAERLNTSNRIVYLGVVSLVVSVSCLTLAGIKKNEPGGAELVATWTLPMLAGGILGTGGLSYFTLNTNLTVAFLHPYAAILSFAAASLVAGCAYMYAPTGWGGYGTDPDDSLISYIVGGTALAIGVLVAARVMFRSR
jgi:hypothetical protein